MPAIKGTAVAPGLALGPVHIVRARPDTVPIWTIPGEAVESEIARLQSALDAAREQLTRQEELVRKASGEQDAGIFAVHRMILEDPGALKQVGKRVREERVNAETAVQTLIDRLRQQMSGLEGDSVRRYADDVSEPWKVVLDLLLERDQEAVAAGDEQVILAAAELTPQVATFLERSRVLAIVTETGGRFSHGAVLARSFGIPCVVGVPNLLARLEQDMQIIVDGDQGTVQLRPTSDVIDTFLESRRQREARQAGLATHASLPAVTPDGAAIGVHVNLESIRDLDTFDVEYCDGVGLLRTEFLYMERNQFPSEEEQYRMYRRVLDHMDGRPVVFRTLDIGGDKQLPYFQTPKETNPALGWRGLRVTLEWADLLQVQLRAILRASAHGDARLLLPMVGSVDQVRRVHATFDRVKTQLRDQGYHMAEDIPVGVMIEVPASVWVLPEMIQEVDFVSVGTNDLTQYVLAADRDNPFVAKLYDPHHPAIVRILARIAEVCLEAGKPFSVCGEMAGDLAATLGLLGMGYTSVSAAPNFLPELRFAVRHTTAVEARELASGLARAVSSEEVQELLAQQHRRLYEQLDTSGMSSPGS